MLRRAAVGYAWIRYRPNAYCPDPPRAPLRGDLLNKVCVTDAQTLEVGDLSVFESDRPLAALFLDYGQPEPRTMFAYVEATQPVTLKVSLPQEPSAIDTFGAELEHRADGRSLTIRLPRGISRLAVSFPNRLYVVAKARSVRPPQIAKQLGLAQVKEATDDWKLNRSKPLAELAYRRPRVYADGAYDGLKGVAPWTAAISDDGELAVVGSHEGYVEALSPAGRLWRTYVKGNCLLDYNYAAPGRNIVGRGHFGNPLAMKPDGSRIFVGTDAGLLYCLARDGRVLWERNVEFRVQSVSISSDAERIAVGADTRLFLFDASGKALFETTVPAAVIDVLVSRDGKSVFYSAGDGTLECLDASGTRKWQYRPRLADVGGATMYRTKMVFTDLAIDASGDALVGCHADYGVYAFNARTGDLRWRWGAEATQSNIVISDDGQRIASNGDGELFYLDASGKVVWKFVAAFFGYNCLRMSRDGRYVGIVNPTGEWFLLSHDKRILTRTPVLTPEPMALGMTPDAKRVVIAGIGYDVLMYENVLD